MPLHTRKQTQFQRYNTERNLLKAEKFISLPTQLTLKYYRLKQVIIAVYYC